MAFNSVSLNNLIHGLNGSKVPIHLLRVLEIRNGSHTHYTHYPSQYGYAQSRYNYGHVSGPVRRRCQMNQACEWSDVAVPAFSLVDTDQWLWHLVLTQVALDMERVTTNMHDGHLTISYIVYCLLGLANNIETVTATLTQNAFSAKFKVLTIRSMIADRPNC